MFDHMHEVFKMRLFSVIFKHCDKKKTKNHGIFFLQMVLAYFGSLVVRLLFSCREMSFSILKTEKEYFLHSTQRCVECVKRSC